MMTNLEDALKKDTSAARAYRILIQAAATSEHYARPGWTSVFGLSSADDEYDLDDYEIRFCIAELVATLSKAHRDFRRSPGNATHPDTISPLIAKLAEHDLSARWSDIQGAIAEAHTLLTLIAMVSEETPDLPDITRDERREWEAAIIELSNSVRMSGIDENLRSFIVAQLVSIQNALVYFDLHGIEGLVASVHAASFAFLHRPEVDQEVCKPDPKGPVSRVAQFLYTVLVRLHLKKVGKYLVSESIDKLAEKALEAKVTEPVAADAADVVTSVVTGG